MLQWKKSRGRQYVFFQSHPGFAFGDENVTREFYDQIMCKEVGDALHLVVERGQRWKCPTYKEGPLLLTLLSMSFSLIVFLGGIGSAPPEERVRSPPCFHDLAVVMLSSYLYNICSAIPCAQRQR